MEYPSYSLTPEQLEELPLDIRRQILHEGRYYSLNREFNEEMQHFKEERCMDPISKREIINTFNASNNTNLKIYSIRKARGDNREFIELYYNDTREYLSNISINISLNNISSNSFTIGYPKPEFNNNGVILIGSRYSFENILLPPSTLRIILLRRGSLCHKHINSVIREHIIDEVNYLDVIRNILFSYVYLIICAHDLGLDMSNIKGYRASIVLDNTDKDLFKINIDYDTVRDNLSSLYQYVIDSLF